MSDHKASNHERKREFIPKAKFTREEDAILLRVVQEIGARDWKMIASHLMGRNARQCRERWNNYVNPDVVNRPWTEEEDKLLMEKYKKNGPRWQALASYFHGRSVNNVKNRWLSWKRNQEKEKHRESSESTDSAVSDSASEPSAVSYIKTQGQIATVPPLFDDIAEIADIFDTAITDMWF